MPAILTSKDGIARERRGELLTPDRPGPNPQMLNADGGRISHLQMQVVSQAVRALTHHAETSAQLQK
jgi:hypothetical protein